MSGTCSFLMSPHADAQALPGRPLGHPIAPGYPRADRVGCQVLYLFDSLGALTLQYDERLSLVLEDLEPGA